VAPDPLFVFVDEKVLEKPTFKAFIAILDNYIAQTGQSEVVTTEERQENQRFLNFAMDTAVMQYVHKVGLKLLHTPQSAL
jgi:poly(U)-specific endoribonuclease